ncbi:hypothetical protein CAEBREN_13705 [Caenorhabditis brenneri]|uniref:DUF38 domain-containing protein n=1 Tax=Caenorhabditis brenneri TaxID=135651 RepID=G0M6Q9_CAEBE|nr:hypothetical protein CAEBREN_13705 [Caenorhabditis brenneri]
MSSDSGDEFKKQLCVLHSFNSSLPPEIALIHVKNSFPFTTLGEIERLYESFRNGPRIGLDEQSNQSEDTQPDEPGAKKSRICPESSSASNSEKKDEISIEEIPVEIVGKILEGSTTEDQKVLHKASPLLSEFISNNFKTYEKVEFYLTEAAVFMRIEKQNPRVILGQKRKLCADGMQDSIGSKISSENSIPTALEILSNTIDSKNVKISKLHIHHEEDAVSERVSDHRKQEFYTGVQEVFNKLKGELHVEELSICIKAESESLMSVLNKLKPGVLVKLEIHNINRSTAKMPMEQIVQSVHWKSLKKVSEHSLLLDLKLDQILHLSYFVGRIVDPTIEELVAHRNKLLQSSLDQCRHVIYTDNLDGIMEAFQPFAPPEEFGVHKGGRFFCQNNKTLHFKLESLYLRFDLQKTK